MHEQPIDRGMHLDESCGSVILMHICMQSTAMSMTLHCIEESPILWKEKLECLALVMD